MRDIKNEDILKILLKVKPYLSPMPYTTLEYRTPAQNMRHQADELDRKEEAIKEFNNLIAELVELISK